MSESKSLGEVYYNIGVKDAGLYAALAKAEKHIQASASDQVKIEAAKNAKLKSLDDQRLREQTSFIGKFKANWLAASAAIAGAGVAVSQAWAMADEAAGFLEQKAALSALGKEYNITGDAIVRKMQEASRGLLAMQEAAAIGAKAMNQDLNPDQIVRFVAVSETMSDIIGGEIPDAFDKMVTAAATGRMQTLAQLGIILDLNDAYRQHAEKMGVSVESLSAVEKQQIRVNAILAEAERKMAKMGPTVDTAKDKMDRLKVTMADIRLMMGQGIIRAAGATRGAFLWLGSGALQLTSYILRLAQGYAFLREAMSFRKSETDKWAAAKNTYKEMADSAAGAASELAGKAAESFSVAFANAEDLVDAQKAVTAATEESTAAQGDNAQAIAAKYNQMYLELDAGALEKIDLQRKKAIEDAKADGVVKGEAILAINKYYDGLVLKQIEQGAEKEREARSKARNDTFNTDMAAWLKAMDEETAKEKERSDIRIQILGTESEKRQAVLDKNKEHYLAIGFDEVEASRLIQAQITSDLQKEADARREIIMNLASSVVDSSTDMYGGIMALQNAGINNEINRRDRANKRLEKEEKTKLKRAVESLELQGLSDEEYLARKTELEEAYEEAKAAREEEYERARAELEYKQQVNSWKAQLVNAMSSAVQGTINAYTSTAAIPIIGPALAPAAAAIAAAFGAVQLATIKANKPQPPEFAEGGSFIVPTRPEYENDGFAMRVQSGERVDVTPADQMSRGGFASGDVYIDGARIGKVLWKNTTDGKWKVARRAVRG